MIGGGADGAWASAGQFMDAGGAIGSLLEFWDKAKAGDPFYEFSALTECLKKVAGVAGVVVDTLALTEQGCNAGAAAALSAILTIVSEIIMQAAVAVAFNPALVATGAGALLVIGLAIGLVMGLKTMATDLFTLTCDARRPA